MKRLLLVLLLCVQVTAAPTRFRVGPMTEFPSLTGVDGQLEMTRHFHFLAQVGFFLGPYASLLRNAGESLGYFDGNTAELIEDILPGSISLRAGVGSHDWPFKGFLLEMAYTYMTGGGAASSAAVLGTIINQDLSGVSTNSTINTSGTIQWLSLHVGYRFKFAPGWHMALRLGVAHPVGSTTEMDITNPNLANALNSRLDSEMDAVYSQVWMPLLSVSFVFGLGVRDYPSTSPDPRSL